MVLCQKPHSSLSLLFFALRSEGILGANALAHQLVQVLQPADILSGLLVLLDVGLVQSPTDAGLDYP